MSKNNLKKKLWPENCVWPEPILEGCGEAWDADDVYGVPLDSYGEELLDIKDYFDQLLEDDILNKDYTLNDDYDSDDDSDPEAFIPEKGAEYWEDGFDYEAWQFELEEHMNFLKIGFTSMESDPVCVVRDTIGYEFINENLLRQAFTRRAFAIEYGFSGCSEELEFLGDSVLNSIVTEAIVKQLMDVDLERTDAPFGASRKDYDEGTLTKIRAHYVSKEYLANRASELGLDRLILYGTGEEPTESSREDMMEALIGAVAVDSNWDRSALEDVVDRLLCLQLTYPDEYLKQSYFDLFNAWHQKHFGCIPTYEVHGGKKCYCTIRYTIPENDKGISTCQRIDVEAESRSKAREKAAQRAYYFVLQKGLWIQLKDAHLIPDLENSINQLQELYQKKYVEEAPVYTFESNINDTWYCDATCGGVNGYGKAASKTKAKKKASYMILVRLLKAAGICEKEWEEEIWKD